MSLKSSLPQEFPRSFSQSRSSYTHTISHSLFSKNTHSLHQVRRILSLPPCLIHNLALNAPTDLLDQANPILLHYVSQLEDVVHGASQWVCVQVGDDTRESPALLMGTVVIAYTKRTLYHAQQIPTTHTRQIPLRLTPNTLPVSQLNKLVQTLRIIV